MMLARVLGSLESCHKLSALTGLKLLHVQPIDPHGRPVGPALLAADAVEAGPGDQVLLLQEGWSVGLVTGRPGLPLDCAVAGVVDQVSLHPPTEPIPPRRRTP